MHVGVSLWLCPRPLPLSLYFPPVVPITHTTLSFLTPQGVAPHTHRVTVTPHRLHYEDAAGGQSAEVVQSLNPKCVC